VFLPLAETAVVSWQLLLLAADCSNEPLPLETPGRRWWSVMSAAPVT